MSGGVSDGSLTDAEFGELEEQGLDWVLRHISEQDADIARLKQEIERILTKAEKDKNSLLVALEAATKEITKLKSFVSELEKWIYSHHYVGDSQAEALIECARKGRADERQF